jgi:formylglycine-generating enzyme required for sulfatase activity
MARKSFFALVCGMAIAVCVAWVAPGWAATVSGTVTDTEGLAVVGAQVTLREEAWPNRVFGDMTDEEGRYRVVLAEVIVAVEEETEGQSVPRDFTLSPNYPNPFNPSTVIPYHLREAGHVRLVIYNTLGQRIRTLMNGVREAGSHTVQWDGRSDAGVGAGAGVYIVRMEAGGFVQSRKMVMVDGADAGVARTQERFREPLAKSTGSSEETVPLYTVTITREDIFFSQTGLPVSEDRFLDFVVQRMALIPAGSFQMGDALNEGQNDEFPVHTVYVDSFYMDVCEVTNAEYCVFLNEQGNQTEGGVAWLDIGSSGCLITKSADQFVPKNGYEDHPVVAVTWYGARAYAQWTGKRLPTEAEWEKAARGGLVGKRYPWGDEDPAGGKCNYAEYSGPLTSEMSNLLSGRGTLPVGSFEPNGYGLYDMAGNVSEWCSDWGDSGYYSNSPEKNPIGPETGGFRILRGGKFCSPPNSLRCADRWGKNPAYSFGAYYGFRCVRPLLPAWTATVSGTVMDAEGQALVGVQVTFKDEAGSSHLFGDMTDGDGRYSVVLAGVAVEEETVHSYTVTITREDVFFKQTGVAVSEDLILDFVIQREDIVEGRMVLIPADSFQMGDAFNEGGNFERPVHTVYVDAFHMDVYEVTNAQYCVFLNEQGNQTEGGYTWLDIGSFYCLITKSGDQFVPESGHEDHPVTEVTWYGARAYSEWAGKRLPTEAEWEKAARGGLEGKRYPWGGEAPVCQDGASNGARFDDNNKCNGIGTAPVGSYSPNGYGLYDMAGNVWEWCSDWLDFEYYSKSPDNNPTGAETGSYRVVRGGSWCNVPLSLRCADREGAGSTNSYRNIGFRCVRSSP